MRRRLTAFLSFCLISLFLFTACSKPADGAYVPIKDESGNITGYERKYHNDNGDVTRWDVYDASEQYDHYVLYEYDSNGRLGKETYYLANGIGEYYYAYSYDEEGNLAEKDYCSAKDGSERVLYKDGVESERLTYDNNDQLIKYEVYQNDTWTEAELPTDSPEADE